MSELTWWSYPIEMNIPHDKLPILQRLFDLSYAAAVLEGLGKDASHIAGGVWGLVNSVLDELTTEIDEDYLVSFAGDLLLQPDCEGSKDDWLQNWVVRINAWEILFRIENTQRVANLFEEKPMLGVKAKQYIDYDGYADFAEELEEDISPGPYLGFIVSAVIALLKNEPVQVVQELVSYIQNKQVTDKVYWRSMQRICTWDDAQGPAEVMRLYFRFNGMDGSG